MKQEEVIQLGKDLGLSYNPKNNYPDQLAKGRVYFDGCNGQRFAIASNESTKGILQSMGYALRMQGRREMKLELSRLLSPMND